MYVFDLLRNRNLIGSDAAIVAASVVHVFEATAFLSTNAANGSVGMAALLMASLDISWLAAAALYSCALLAIVAEWAPDLSYFKRFMLMFPQFVLLMVTATGAIFAVLVSHYADGVIRPWPFIACDQVWRIVAPGWYGVAILARVREH